MKRLWIIGILIFVSLISVGQQRIEPKAEQKKNGTEQAIKKVPKAKQNKTQIQKTQIKKKQIQRTQVQRRKTAQISRKKKAIQRRKNR